MTVNKYTGKTKEEAVEAAKKELGPSVVIMHVKEVKKGGFLGMFKSTSFEVTAGVEDDLVQTQPKNQTMSKTQEVKKQAPKPSTSRFDAVVDEEIDLRPSSIKATEAYSNSSNTTQEDDWKDAFAEINKVLLKSENDSNFIKKEDAVILSDNESETTSSTNASRNNIRNNISNKNNQNNISENKNTNNSSDNNDFKELQAKKNTNSDIKPASRKNNYKFVKMLYNTLLDNEVDEKYINQISDDMGKVFANGSNIDYLISNVYQKMVLMMEEPKLIELSNEGPKVVFFIGPTGVGKTTTIAKIASDFVLRKEKKVAFLTADTYRLGATDQLREYANIIGIPMNIVLTPEDINKSIKEYEHYDLILVDTAGFSHKNQAQKDDMSKILATIDPAYSSETYLVLSATTKYKDLLEIIDTYKEFCDFNLIFTKLDETSTYGNILNCKLYSKSQISYVTNGQNVPHDIEVLDTQKIVKQLLGGQ